MTQRESRLSRKIRDEMKAEWPDIFCFKVWGSEHMMAGLPDLIGCLYGRFFGLEVKLPEARNNVSDRQVLVMGWIQRAQGLTAVVCSGEEAIAVLRRAVPKNLR